MNYVHISGVKDSTAMAILLHEDGLEFELVFADTGAELPETLWTVSRVARVLGKKLNVVSNGTFYQRLVSLRYFLPDMNVRWCTQSLKVVPLQRLCNKPENTIYIGYRADEPNRLNPKKEKMPWIAEKRFPLVEKGLGREDVMRICAKYDLLNPAYKWRSSVSCARSRGSLIGWVFLSIIPTFTCWPNSGKRRQVGLGIPATLS